MQLVKNDSLILNKKDRVTRSKPLSFDIIMSIVYMLLIIIGMFNNLATLVAFLLIVVVFYMISIENVIAQMMFLMSFATIFKQGPSSTSLFTVISFYVVLLMVWRKPAFKAKELLLLCLFGISIVLSVLINNNLQLLLILKFFAAMLLVMGFKNSNYQKELPNYISLFILGLVLSSVIAYFGTDISQIDLYITKDRVVDSNWQGSFYTDTVRFSGLNADPNYYSINLYIGIIGALVLDNKGAFKQRIWVYMGVAVLFFFGLQTVSKSFAFMALVIAIYILFIIIKNKKYGVLFWFALAVAFIIAMAITGKIEILNTLLKRVTQSIEEGNITTGRTSIWQNYFDYLESHPKMIPFGAGFGYGFGGLIAAHNTYVESITCLGVVGSILLLVFFGFLFAKEDKTQRRSLENYSVLLIIIVMYTFLSMLTWVDFPFHLFLCYCFLNYKAENKTALK